jgi:hypothetical protein
MSALPHFVEQGARHRTETVRGHFVLGIAETTKSRVDRVL